MKPLHQHFYRTWPRAEEVSFATCIPGSRKSRAWNDRGERLLCPPSREHVTITEPAGWATGVSLCEHILRSTRAPSRVARGREDGLRGSEGPRRDEPQHPRGAFRPRRPPSYTRRSSHPAGRLQFPAAYPPSSSHPCRRADRPDPDQSACV